MRDGLELPIEPQAFLRWAGSKRRVLHRLLEFVPPAFKRYVEPFAGSACLFFRLQPQAALLSDINPHLIQTYIQVRDNVEEVVTRLRRFKGDEEEYYRIRSLGVAKCSLPEQAARFIYLNRFCFNGLYRTNLSGIFNVPYGGARSGQLPSPEFLRRCSCLLTRADLRACSFEVCLGNVQAGDFVYLDPPYSIASRRVFNEYSNANFGPSQLLQLKGELARIDKLGIPFLVSYGYSREALELGRSFKTLEIVVQRQIAGFAGDRKKSRELIITNF
jgi:DNA adenine methylase